MLHDQAGYQEGESVLEHLGRAGRSMDCNMLLKVKFEHLVTIKDENLRFIII